MTKSYQIIEIMESYPSSTQMNPLITIGLCLFLNNNITLLNKIYMNSIIDQQFVANLFHSNHFQEHLSAFIYEHQHSSCKPEISFSQTVDSSTCQQLDNVSSQIQNLLSQIYSSKLTGQIQLVIENYNIVYDTLRQLKAQVQDIAIKIQSSDFHFNPKQFGEEYPTIEQYRKWEHDILQRVDICGYRNANKIQSIFSDKLNNCEMKVFDRVERIQDDICLMNERIKGVEERFFRNQAIFGAERQQIQNRPAEQSELAKKLKNSKSIGSLLGFGK